MTTGKIVFKAGVLHASINCLITNDFAWWNRNGKRRHCSVHVCVVSGLPGEVQDGGREGEEKNELQEAKLVQGVREAGLVAEESLMSRIYSQLCYLPRH